MLNKMKQFAQRPKLYQKSHEHIVCNCSKVATAYAQGEYFLILSAN